MASMYTYDDFVKAANNAGLLNSFSQDDLTISQKSPEFGLSLLKLQQDAAKATTSEQKLLAQEAVNQLRKTYNALPTTTAANSAVTGSSTPATPVTNDGTASSAVPGAASPGGSGYSYGGENAYQKALQGVTEYAPYSYDYKSDPTYGQMRDTYLADNQFMEDKTLSNPAVTGSMVPSYGAAAAGQSANYYAGKLNDIIPQLEQDAYERYLKDFQLKNGQLEAAAADKAFDHQQWKTQQELELAAIQQKYANDTILHQQFQQDAPVLPDLSRLGTGTSVVSNSDIGATGTAAAGETGAEAAPAEPLVPEYNYQNASGYQAALDAVLNNPAFSYAIQNDPQYGSLRKSYMREGQRANEDALARASAGSMGIPSSYALRQATDAGNAYNEQLMNAIPGLQDNAYGRYLSDFQQQLDTLGQLSADRELDYKQWLQNYELDQKIKQQNFDNALAQYRMTRQMTPEIAAALGIEYKAPGAGWYGNASGGPRTSDFENTLDAAIRQAQRENGYLANSKADQSGLNYSINKAINQAQSSGQITSSQAAALKQQYIGAVGGFLMT